MHLGEEKVFIAKDNFMESDSKRFLVVKRLSLKIGAQVLLLLL